MSNLQTYYHFKLDFHKVDRHTGGELLIYGIKHVYIQLLIGLKSFTELITLGKYEHVCISMIFRNWGIWMFPIEDNDLEMCSNVLKY